MSHKSLLARCLQARSAVRRIRPKAQPWALEHLEDRSTPALFNVLSPATIGNNNNFGCVATGDFNGDGKSDIVMTNYGTAGPGNNAGGNTLVVRLGTGSGTFTGGSTITVGTGQYVSYVAVGDVNNDGKQDLAVASSSDSAAGNLTVFLGTGNGGFSKQSPLSTNSNNACWVGIAQMTNGDTNADIVVCSFGAADSGGNSVSGNNVSVFQGDGNGAFSLIETVSDGLSFIPTALALADFDGDGNMDIAAAVPGVPPDSNADQPNGYVYMFLGNGSGGFTSGNVFDSGGPLPISMSLADFNGDSEMDLVVANAGNPDSNSFYANFGGGSTIAVLLSIGAGNFDSPITLTAGIGTSGSKSVFAVTAADFDLDGNTDVAGVLYGHPLTGANARVLAFKGNGNGGFTADANSPYNTNTTGGQFLAAADFNGDSAPDIVAVTADSTISVLLNTTTGSASTTTSLITSASPSTYGQAVTFTATVTSGSGTPTGTVTFKNGGTTIGTGTLNAGGVATFTTSSLQVAGSPHSITASYGGGVGFAASSSNTVSQIVNQASSSTALDTSGSPMPYGFAVTFTATVSSPGGTPLGAVTFLDSGVPIGGGVLNASGVATFTTSTLSVGSHTITVQYAGSTNFSGSTSSTITQEIVSASTTTTLTSSTNPSPFGSSVTFTATVASGGAVPTGTVTFIVDGTSVGTGNLNSGGVATFSTSTLPMGSHVVSAQYGSTTSFAGSTSSDLTQVVTAATTSVTLSTSENPSTIGTPVTFTASVTSSAGTPGGTVTFLDGGSPIGSGNLNASGVATFTTGALSLGSHAITAQYEANGNYAASTSSTLTQTVVPYSTTTAISSSLNPSPFGQIVTFTATVTSGGGTPSGTVTFFDGVNSIGIGGLNGTGVATFSISTLSIGSHDITAQYGASGNFAGSTSSAVTQIVNSAATSTTIESSLTPSAFGSNVTFTATVTSSAGTPGGTVTFFNGVSELGTITLNAGGIATFSTAALAVGTHSITAQYSGNSSYAGSTSSPLTQTVNPAPTTTSLATSGTPAVFGSSITFTATVVSSGGSPSSGVVTFLRGGISIGTANVNLSGVASLTLSSLPGGSHTITGQFGGNTNFAPSTSPAITQTINPIATSITLSSSQNPSQAGQSVTFTAQITPVSAAASPTGTITFFSGANSLGTVAAAAGPVAFTTSSLPVGELVITAVYGGDSNYTAATSPPVNQVVNSTLLVGFPQFAVGAGAGGPGTARFFNPDGSHRFDANVFPGFTGGVRVTSADFNGDGIADIVAGTGPGAASQVAIINGKTQALMMSIAPFEPAFVGGVYVTTGDVTGDGVADIIISPDEGGGPRCVIYNGKSFVQFASFFGINDPNFRGGARTAVSDFNSDGIGDLIVSAGFGGGPRIAGYLGGALGNGQLISLFHDFFAFEVSLRNGAFISAGDIDGDGIAELIAGGGPGGGPRVTAFSGAAFQNDQVVPVLNMFAGNPANRGGVRMVARNLDDDALADLVIGDGTGAGSHVTGYYGKDLKAIGAGAPIAFEFDAYPGFNGGVYVG